MNKTLAKVKSILSKDKRRTERLSLPITIFYTLYPHSEWTGPIPVEEIGGGGLKFKSKIRIKKNTEINLRIDIPHQPPINVRGEVVWCKKISSLTTKQAKLSPLYTIGIRFYKMKYSDRQRFITYISEKILDEFLSKKEK